MWLLYINVGIYMLMIKRHFIKPVLNKPVFIYLLLTSVICYTSPYNLSLLHNLYLLIKPVRSWNYFQSQSTPSGQSGLRIWVRLWTPECYSSNNSRTFSNTKKQGFVIFKSTCWLKCHPVRDLSSNIILRLKVLNWIWKQTPIWHY